MTGRFWPSANAEARPVMKTSRLSLLRPASRGAPEANQKKLGSRPCFSNRPWSLATYRV
ncbi:Uncharacterised protein [Bordetella pertussis]|nr:Uncharacterised protein [Bordetella pertussis]